VELIVLQPGAYRVLITEVVLSQHPVIELSCLGPMPTNLSGWSLMAWADSQSPLPLAWDTFPVGCALQPASTVVVEFGGSPGGLFPSFNTGSNALAWPLALFAVAVVDANGQLVDFVAIGSIDPSE